VNEAGVGLDRGAGDGHTVIVKAVHLDDRTALLSFRGIAFLACVAMLTHSVRQEHHFSLLPFLLAGAYLASALLLWRSRSPKVHSALGQGLALLWDVSVISTLLYFSEGFEDELYFMYFLILFMSAMLAKPWQSFLVGTVATLIYAGLWNKGHVAHGLPLVNLLLRFAFFYVAAFLAAVIAGRDRDREERLRAVELRFALERLANGGWGSPPPEGLDPHVAKTVRTLDSLLDNMSAALKRVMDQNEDLRRTAQTALLQLQHEKERLEAEKKAAQAREQPK
jgi:hypothetical protein